MANVIDVSATGEPDAPVLTQTEKSGVFGSSNYLRSEPLQSYLDEAEVPQYVFRNKKSGLRIEPIEDGATGTPDGGSATIGGSATAGESADPLAARTDGVATGEEQVCVEPVDGYQALGAVTDVRIVFVVGALHGDRSVSVPLSDVVAVDVENSILGGELAITAADGRYVFPCRGGLGPIAEYVDLGSQAWTRTYSLLDDAHDSLARAETRRDEADFTDAVEAIEDGLDAVAAARDRIAEFGDGAARYFEPEADQLRNTLERRRREIHADHGVHAHERARTHWGNRKYERAHEAYGTAETALKRAQDLEETDGIDDRLERIDEELADLADAPLSYASAMVQEAEESEDAWTSAQCWAVAVERYRDVYALDWGREDERFRGDPVVVREHVLSAVDALVERRVEGLDGRLQEAEWLRQSDDIEGAREVLTAAIDALADTRRLADELTHREYPELAEARAEAEADLALLPGES